MSGYDAALARWEEWGSTIPHPDDCTDDDRPDAEEAPAATEAPSGTTPDSTGRGLDRHQRTQ